MKTINKLIVIALTLFTTTAVTFADNTDLSK
jgi:hypothetical protein